MKNIDYDNIDLNNLDWSLYNDETKGYIYTITNTVNGKQYIGQTNNPYKRWKKHLSVARLQNYKFNSYLYPAMKKYGIINFKFEVIDICSINEVNEKEIYWIKQLNTYAPNGYNLSYGGMALYGEDNPFYGRKHTEESKRRISEKNKGREISEKEREMRRVINTGEKNPFYHKKHSEETKKKIIETSKKNGVYEQSSYRMKGNQLAKFIKRKRVAMVSKESGEILRVFNNAVEAGEYVKELGLCTRKDPNNSITSVCKGHDKSVYGYIWRYLEDDYDSSN